MSADNWAVCPRCRNAANAKTKARRKQVEDAYGKIPADQYLKMREEFSVEVQMEFTLREDYEIGIDQDDKFYVIYRGACSTCEFSFEFNHEKKVPDR